MALSRGVWNRTQARSASDGTVPSLALLACSEVPRGCRRMANPLFAPEIREMLGDNDEAALVEMFDALHPATIAETLADEFSVEDAWRVLCKAPLHQQAAVFEY